MRKQCANSNLHAVIFFITNLSATSDLDNPWNKIPNKSLVCPSELRCSADRQTKPKRLEDSLIRLPHLQGALLTSSSDSSRSFILKFTNIIFKTSFSVMY